MKKTAALITILVIANIVAYGQDLIAFGGAASFHETIVIDRDENKTSHTAEVIGVNTTFIRGDEFVFYSFSYLGIPLDLTEDDENIIDSMYMRMAGEAIVGGGYSYSPVEEMTLVGALGLHINGFFYDALNKETSDWYTRIYSGLGLGIGGVIIYEIIPQLIVGININIGLDFSGIINETERFYSSGSTVNLGISFYTKVED